MANTSLASAITAYLLRHLGSQYTAAQVAVYHHGQRVTVQSVGIQTVYPYFDFASLTKLFTTTAILQAVSAGKISLQTPIAELIPAFAESGGRTVVDGGMNPHTYAIEPVNPDFSGQTIDPSTVTIFHLLTHTSGLAPWRKLYHDDAPPPPPTQPDPIPRHERWAHGLDIITSSPFIAPAGVAVRYSDLGFMLLGEALSRLHADSDGLTSPNGLESAITRLIAQFNFTTPASVIYPASHIVHDSGLAPDISPFAPTEYDARWRQRRVWREVHDENACGVGGVAGHAGLFGTADALAQFGVQWCNHTVPDIAPELTREAVRQHAETSGERRGLGWMLRSLDKSTAGTRFGVNSFGHTGFVGNMLWVDPDQDIVVCCLTNNVYYGRQKPGLFEFRVGLNDLIWEALCSS